MTTIAVIAANGRTGRVFVRRALAVGYHVRAGVYRQSGFDTHKNLTVVQCNALDKTEVETLIDGADVVVSLIGHGRASPPRLQSRAIATIIDAIGQNQYVRLISLTGTGVRQPDDTPSFVDKVVTMLLRRIDPNRIDDGIEHARILQKSNVRWTIVRVLKLSNGSHKGSVRFSLTGPAELLTPRERVAIAIFELIESDDYIRKMPVIVGKYSL